jgi:SPP1 family predicted phage head-tail adaptor
MKFERRRFMVTIERRVAGNANAFGERAETWEEHASTYASIDGLLAREVEIARGFSATASYKINTRFIDGVKSAMRVRFGDRIFQIDGVLDRTNRREELDLFCTEVVSG